VQTATLTISMLDYNKMQSDLAQARAEAAAAREEALKYRLGPPDGLIEKLTAFARDCLTIARFGVANLPPEMIPGWPHKELKRICETIDGLPDCSVNDRDMAIDLLGFVRDCEEHELRRRGAAKAPQKLTPEEIAAERARLESEPMGQLALHLASKPPE